LIWTVKQHCSRHDIWPCAPFDPLFAKKTPPSARESLWPPSLQTFQPVLPPLEPTGHFTLCRPASCPRLHHPPAIYSRPLRVFLPHRPSPSPAEKQRHTWLKDSAARKPDRPDRSRSILHKITHILPL